MEAQHVAAIALALAALGLLLIAALLVVRLSAARRSERTLMHALDERALQSAALNAAARGGERADTAALARGGQPAGWKRLFERFAHAGVRWLDTPLGRQIVAEEDRRLLEQCGFVDTRMRGLFLMARILGMAILPLVAGMLAREHVSGSTCVVIVIVAALAGFMLPKIYVARRASRRRNGVIEELPLMVDLLRLLQGVGLSLDQSLQVMVSDFRTVLPVLSHELEIAQRQFAAGRPRDQSLNRLAASYDNEDLRAVVRLLIQVDRHGGAVQEPLKLFGDRLREARRAMLRERIGRLTVKMTGVMIVTLLPALMIVTAGPGVLAVTKSLHSTQR